MNVLPSLPKILSDGAHLAEEFLREEMILEIEKSHEGHEDQQYPKGKGIIIIIIVVVVVVVVAIRPITETAQENKRKYIT